MAIARLSVGGFLDLVEGAYLRSVSGEPGTTKRVWSLLQVSYGNKDVHWEVWPQNKTGQVEIGLHFEAERETSYAWATRLGEFAGTIFAELGPRAELEEWTSSWARLHETLPFTRLSEELAEEVGARLAAYVTVLAPLLEQADIPFRTPAPRRPAPKKRHDRFRRKKRVAL
ncbi:MAG: hypothetical protein WEB00_02230 [Dehalococcoidia bacterium]